MQMCVPSWSTNVYSTKFYPHDSKPNYNPTPLCMIYFHAKIKKMQVADIMVMSRHWFESLNP